MNDVIVKLNRAQANLLMTALNRYINRAERMAHVNLPKESQDPTDTLQFDVNPSILLTLRLTGESETIPGVFAKAIHSLKGVRLAFIDQENEVMDLGEGKAKEK